MSKKRSTIGIITILLGFGVILFSLLPLYTGTQSSISTFSTFSHTAATETAGMTVGIVLIIIGAIVLIVARKRVPEHTAKRQEEIRQAYAELERIQADHKKQK